MKRTSGDCYIYNNEQAEACDFTRNGMPEDLKKMVEEVTWNTGTIFNDITNDVEEEVTPIKIYEYERSKNDGKHCESGESDECNDEVERTYTWKGKVGLMYPSESHPKIHKL